MTLPHQRYFFQGRIISDRLGGVKQKTRISRIDLMH